MQHNTRDRITDHKYLTEMQRIKNQYPNRKSRKRSWHKRALVTWQQATQLSLTNRATHMCKCNSRKKGEIYEQICLLSQSALAIRNWYYYLIKIALVKSVFSHVSVIFVCYHLYGVVNKIFNGASDLKHAPSHMCYHAEFGRSRSNGAKVIKEYTPLKFDPSHPAFQGHSRSS